MIPCVRVYKPTNFTSGDVHSQAADTVTRHWIEEDGCHAGRPLPGGDSSRLENTLSDYVAERSVMLEAEDKLENQLKQSQIKMFLAKTCTLINR